jgi:putative hydrolase of the HAD superfamily
MIKALIFDWGNTVMRDFPENPGPMAHWDHVEYIPNIEECLNNLSKKYIMCIASNAGFSDAALMTEALKRVGAEKYFHYFFTSKDIGAEKPDKHFFNSIIKKIIVDPEQCIMIGDNYAKDIRGAKAIGMKTILFNEKLTVSDFFDADEIIVSMKELVTAVDVIENKS